MTDTTHECPRDGCKQRVPRWRLACPPHWFALPLQIRYAVLDAYTDHGAGSDPHRHAILEAIRVMNK